MIKKDRAAHYSKTYHQAHKKLVTLPFLTSYNE